MDEAEELGRLAAEGQLRLFNPDDLAPIHQLNSRLLTALIEEASEAAPATERLPAAHIGDRLLRASPAARADLSQVPVSLVDAGFREEGRWEKLADGDVVPTDNTQRPFFGRQRAVRLAYQTFDTATTAARVSPEHAMLTFGMARTVARLFAGMSGEKVLWLRKHCAHWVVPRWHTDLAEWDRLVAAAQHSTDEGVLPAAKYRVMARLFWEMEPSATCTANETRRSRG